MLARGKAVLLVVLVLALTSLAAAAAASAEPPEFGRCVDGLESEGQYSDRECTMTTGSPKLWEWRPVTNGGFAIQKGKSKFATTAGALECSGLRGQGTFTDAKTVDEFQFRFTGCKLGPSLCASSGAAAGEVATSTLVMRLGFAEVAGPHKTTQQVSAVEFSPVASEAPFAQLSCGANAITLAGAPIAAISHKARTRTLTISFKAVKGKQAIEHLISTPGQPLESSVNGGPFTPGPIKGNLKALTELLIKTTA
jgi:hypothetical protein